MRHSTYRLTYLVRALKLCCAELDSPLSRTDCDAAWAAAAELREVETDLLADLVDYAIQEHENGFRHLGSWWAEGTVRALLRAEPGHIGAREIRAFHRARYPAPRALGTVGAV